MLAHLYEMVKVGLLFLQTLSLCLHLVHLVHFIRIGCPAWIDVCVCVFVSAYVHVCVSDYWYIHYICVCVCLYVWYIHMCEYVCVCGVCVCASVCECGSSTKLNCSRQCE